MSMIAAGEIPGRQIRARFTADTITVYQAFNSEIADRAIAAGTFVKPFKFDRMTWIKPSFLWMMYRSGWAMKPGQERILAIDISREGFEYALAHSVLTSYEPRFYASRQEWVEYKEAAQVRVQWDPDRSLLLEPLPWRCIQVGLSGGVVRQYAGEWISALTDITAIARQIGDLVAAGDHETASSMLPREKPYVLSASLRRTIGAT